MGCGSSSSLTVEVTTVSTATTREEWNAIRKKFMIGKTKYEARQRDKLWDEIDKDHSGTLTYAEVERGAIAALGLTNLMPVEHLRPVLVRAYNAAKLIRTGTTDTTTNALVRDLSYAGGPPSPSKGSPLKKAQSAISFGNENEILAAHDNVKTLQGITSDKKSPKKSDTDEKNEEAQEVSELDSPSPAILNPLSTPPRKGTAPIVVKPIGLNTFLEDTKVPQGKVTTKLDPAALSQSASINISNFAASNSVSNFRQNKRKAGPTSNSASLSVKQKEQASSLQREEFRLFLMYIADYMELYVVFTDIIASTNSNRNRKSFFSAKVENKNMTMPEFVSAMPRLKSWGINSDEDPKEIFEKIDFSQNGTITFKEFSDWIVVQHSQHQQGEK